MAVDVEPAPVVAPTTSPRRTLLIGVAATTAVALVVGGLAAWAWHWRTHPTVLPEVGNSVGMKMSLDKRPTMYFGVTYPEGESETITVDSIAPRLFENSAGASFVFYACHIAPGGPAVGVVNPAEFDRICLDAVPVVKDTSFAVGERARTQLVMGVTVHRPGRVVARGVEVAYETGHQSGTQATGLNFRLEAR